jgi:UDP-N-acetylmuramoyl-L-alanyl-D-glutamate--2,6-diaminopimelate ligase
MNAASSMKLKELVAGMQPLKVEGPVDRDITGIVYDSRRVTPGAMFVAIRGQHHDGHAFIDAAIERGAAAILCEQNGFHARKATRVKVTDTRAALAEVAAKFNGEPSARLNVIGVTGTNGKTTVTFMLKRILETAGLKTGLIGTVRYEIGERVIPAHRTTPESLEMQQMLASMVRDHCRACVMEVSSHALDQHRVRGVHFDTAIFTNLTQDHLDYHGTMEDYFTAKQKLFTPEYLGSKSGSAVINIDDQYGLRLAADTAPTVTFSYGFNQAARVRAVDIRLGAAETRFTVEWEGRRLECVLPLIGRHNIYNALAAFGAALALKIEPAQIISALASMPPVPGRLEHVDAGQPFNVFVDYAHTDDALRNVLTALREVTSGRLLLLFGCGGNRDTGKRAQMGRVAAELADHTIITTDNPRKESPEAIATQIQDGFTTLRPDGFSVELDRQRAIETILRMARPGDTVLIAGKGHETYQEFENTVVPFDDREHAREALELQRR